MRVGIPFFHIADALGHALAADGLTRVGLLGTRLTMVEDFYATRLREGFGIDVILPDKGQIGLIDAVIFDELCRGIVEDSSRNSYLEIMDGLAARGRGHHPRLYRDRDAGQAGAPRHAAVLHNASECTPCCRVGFVGLLTISDCRGARLC